MQEDKLDRNVGSALRPRRTDKLRLPPCRVCQENASGFHYGVNTCNACKGFFRRSMLRKEKNKCVAKGNCDITLSSRHCCPSCRYNKCLAVGMSINAIKIGRYTHSKKTQDTLEVKMLEECKVPQNQQGDSRAFNYDLPTLFTPEEETADTLINLLLTSHDKYMKTAFSVSAMENTEKNQQAYYEKYRLKIAMFGSLSPLPKEQYDEIYQTTGIDIDNRQDTMKMLAATMEMDIRRYINFMLSVPGFKMLFPDDQANLIKNSCFEFNFLGSFRGYNNRIKILSTSSGKCLHIQEVCMLWDKDFVLALFNFSDSLKSLNLSEEECVLIKTMLVFFRDRCELQNPEQVESIQWKAVCALRQLLAKNHSRPNLRFAKIMDRLTAMRILTEWNNKIIKSLSQWPAVRERPLLLEMLAK